MRNVKLTNDDLNKVVKAVKKTRQSAKILLNTRFNEIEVVIGMNASPKKEDAIMDAVWDLGLPLRNLVVVCGDSSELRNYKVVRV